MAEYYINNTPLSQFQIMPLKANGDIAISGCFDLPKRKGTTYVNWPLLNSVEPYVDADDIEFSEREITLYGIITEDSDNNIWLLKEFLESLPETFTLSCKWGNWNVKHNNITIETVNRISSKVTLKFTESNPVLSGILPPISETKEIDNYQWISFGLWIKGISGYQSIGTPKKLNVTQNLSSSLPSFGGRDKTEITVSGIIESSNIDQFKNNISALYALFGSPGIRLIQYRDLEIKCFCADGFTISDVKIPQNIYAKFNCKLIVVNDEVLQYI